MNTALYASFPLLGRWRLIRAVNQEKEISEPAQESEFLPDGTCIYFIKSPSRNQVIRLTGKYCVISPDHFWTDFGLHKSGATLRFIINGKAAEFHANNRVHYLRKIERTEFNEDVIDGK